MFWSKKPQEPPPIKLPDPAPLYPIVFYSFETKKSWFDADRKERMVYRDFRAMSDPKPRAIYRHGEHLMVFDGMKNPHPLGYWDAKLEDVVETLDELTPDSELDND